MVLIAPRSAKLVEARGSRFTLLAGYVFCLLGFLTMLLLWKEDISYWKVGLGYAFIGIGVGFAGTPASHSLTGSVPVRPRRHGLRDGGPAARSRRRDHAVDPRRSANGRLCRAAGAAIAAAPNGEKINDSVQSELTKSFSSAADTASRVPEYASNIIAAAKSSFLQGDEWAYIAGIVAILIGAAIVFFGFPHKEQEEQLLVEYHQQDVSTRPPANETTPQPATASRTEASLEPG